MKNQGTRINDKKYLIGVGKKARKCLKCNKQLFPSNKSNLCEKHFNELYKKQK